MIKMGGRTKSGRKFVLLGITDNNIKALREGKPLVVNGAEIDVLEMETLVIHWRATEKELIDELSPMIGETTRVTDHRSEKKN